MIVNREQVEAEAEAFVNELYPNARENASFLVEMFVAGRTVTAEQVEAAAWEFALQTKVPYERMPSHHRHYWRQITIAAFRAAGFYVEDADEHS